MSRIIDTEVKNEDTFFPLSSLQQAIWFYDSTNENKALYNLVKAIRIEGNLKYEFLISSIKKVVERHSMLRAHLVQHVSSTLQTVSERIEIPLRIINKEQFVEQKRLIKEYIHEEAMYQFDIFADILFRCTIIEEDVNVHVFILNIHHIISDGLSISNFFHELLSIYYCMEKNYEINLPDIKSSYRDYIDDINRYQNSDQFQEDLFFWNSFLSETSGGQTFPSSGPVNKQDSDVQSISYPIPEPLYKEIKEYIKTKKVTLFMFLYSCFCILLNKYTDERDIVVGTPMAERMNYDYAGLIGLYANTVVTKCKIDPADSYDTFLKKTAKQLLMIYEHQRIPFPLLVEKFEHIERTEKVNPFFQVLFSLQNSLTANVEMEGFSFENIKCEHLNSKYDISFLLEEQQNTLDLMIEYNGALYDRSNIDMFCRHYLNIINYVIQHPNSCISSIVYMTKEEEQRYVEHQEIKSICSSDTSILSIIRNHCVNYKNEEAIAVGEKSITYAETSDLIGRIANVLKSNGIGKNDNIGLCLQPGILMIPSILAIWSVGACYVPVPYQCPENRFEFIVQNANIRYILSENDKPEERMKNHVKVVNLYKEIDNVHRGQEFETTIDLDKIAYILYTSGSTGNPKGVKIQHKSLLNFLLSFKKYLKIKKNDVMLSVSNNTFDISMLEFFLPLISAGSVVMANEKERTDGKLLIDLIDKVRPDFMQATPAMWKLCLSAGWKGLADKLHILCGGEKLESVLADQLRCRCLEFFNVYGPTETTIWSLIYKDKVNNSDTIPIGKPIDNTYVYIFDSSMKPVPYGVIGELYIGGLGVALGYQNLESETESRFLIDPWDKSQRIYRTGDMAKRCKDGNIYFAGRNDQQVKVRGYRIELNEISKRIQKLWKDYNHEVLIYQDSTGENAIALFLEVNECCQFSVDDVYDYLRGQLPAYMIPNVIQFIDKIPMNQHGKVDSSLLRKSIHEVIKEKHGFVPKDDQQAAYASIWKRILNLSDVNEDTNFFISGGHSLLAIKLLNLIEEEFGVTITFQQLLKYPSFGGLYYNIVQAKERKHNVTGCSLKIQHDEKNKYRPFTLTDIQRAYWIGENSSVVQNNMSTQIYYELESDRIDIQKFCRVINVLIQRHDMLRAVISESGQQAILRSVPVYDIKKYDLIGQTEHEIEEQLNEIREELSNKKYQSSQWPLFDIRVSNYKNLSRIHISVNMLIADAWSFKILMDEMSTLYFDIDKDLPSIQISYRDYIIGMQNLKNTELYKKAESYWMDKLCELNTYPQLPLKCDISEISQPCFCRKSLYLDPRQWACLKVLAQQIGITPTVLVLTIFVEVLNQFSDVLDYTLNVTVFNRPDSPEDIKRMVGDFTTSLLFHVNTTGLSFRERAGKIQHNLWRDMDYSIYSGTKVMYQLMRQGLIDRVFPIVFTSLLGMDSKNEFHSGMTFAKVQYGSSRTSQVWFDCQVANYADGLQINWDYIENLFKENLIDQMFQQLTHYVKKVTSEDFGHMLDVPLSKGNMSKDIQGEDKFIFTEFQKRVKEQPQKIALVNDEVQMTYSEVDALSNKIANKLSMQYSVGAHRIFIFMKKGWEQVVTALAIVKAGYTYVPIDSSTPMKRLQYQLVTSNAKGIFVDKATAEVFQKQCDIDVYLFDDTFIQKLYDVDAHFPSCKNYSTYNLAYIIYTSGSTGMPKGVMINHSAVVNTIDDINHKFEVRNNDKVLALSSLAFDLSVYDIFGTLSAGGTIVIPNADRIWDIPYLHELVNKRNVTIWNSVPSWMNMFLTAEDGESEEAFRNLRLVLLSGDWIPTDMPSRLKEKNQEINVISLGGATEAAIWSTFYEIKKVDSEWRSIPYGKALDQQAVYVLDEEYRKCGVNEIGRIYIAGKGLADGYVNNNVQTKERFFHHPLTGERLYSTGDLGRYMEDGNIEFLGRDDSQVKINGYRIELSEIEHVIRKTDLVKDVVVIADGEKDNKRLLAYIVPKDGVSYAQDEEIQISNFVDRLQFKMNHKGIRKNLQSDGISLDSNNSIQVSDYYMRRSYREFDSRSLTLQDISHLLMPLSIKYFDGIAFPKYRYASAGGLYPVQLYLMVKENTVQGLDAGTYYYHPEVNQLLKITDAYCQEDVHVSSNQRIYRSASFMVCLCADKDAIVPMYGEKNSERFCMLEAGEMIQLLEENAVKNGLGLCQLGVVDENKVIELLAVNKSCLFLSCLVGGAVSQDQLSFQGFKNSYKEFQKKEKEVESHQRQEDITNRLRDSLREILPYYMMPCRFILIDKIPLTSNGKYDIKLLKQRIANIRKTETYTNTVKTEISLKGQKANVQTMLKLQEICKLVFKNGEIGYDDNFFDFGGDSITIALIYRELEKQFKKKISIIDIFRYPTIRSLASFFDNSDNDLNAAVKLTKKAERRIASRNRYNCKKTDEYGGR